MKNLGSWNLIQAETSGEESPPPHPEMTWVKPAGLLLRSLTASYHAKKKPLQFTIDPYYENFKKKSVP